MLVIILIHFNIVFDGNSTTLEESSFIFIAPLMLIAFIIAVWILSISVVTVWMLSIRFNKSIPITYYSVEFFSGITSEKNK